MSRNNTATNNYRWQFGFFIVIHLFIFVALFHTLYSIQYSATGLYFDYASNILKGLVPYRDFTLEYPPFALFFFILPRLAGHTWPIFSVYYQAEVVIFDLIGLWILYKIAYRWGKAPWTLLSVYTLGILAIGPIIGQQYDIFPAVMTLAAIYYFWTDRHTAAWALLALGTLTKIYPIALAPIFLIYYIRDHQYQRLWQGIASFAAVCLAIILPFLIISPSCLWSFYSYHAQRGIQLESTYSSLLLLADKLGFTHVRIEFGFGSWNVAGNAANVLAKMSAPVLAVLLLLTYGFIFRRSQKIRLQIDRIGAYSLLAVLIILITSKVLSPQYLIWLIPFLPLLTGRLRYAIWSIFVLIGVLTFIIFPVYYQQLMDLSSRLVDILLTRDLLLVVMAILVGYSLFRPSRETDVAAS